MTETDLIHGRAELLLRPDFETTSAAMFFSSRPQHLFAVGPGMGKAAALPYHLPVPRNYLERNGKLAILFFNHPYHERKL
jgi:hypothetical protein